MLPRVPRDNPAIHSEVFDVGGKKTTSIGWQYLLAKTVDFNTSFQDIWDYLPNLMKMSVLFDLRLRVSPNTRRSPKAVSMLVHHLPRWPSIEPALGCHQHRVVVNIITATNMRRWTNVGLMLVQRLRRWPNIKPTLVKCLLFTGRTSSKQTQNICMTFVQRRPNVYDVGSTLYKCYTNVFCLLSYCIMVLFWFYVLAVWLSRGHVLFYFICYGMLMFLSASFSSVWLFVFPGRRFWGDR